MYILFVHDIVWHVNSDSDSFYVCFMGVRTDYFVLVHASRVINKESLLFRSNLLTATLCIITTQGSHTRPSHYTMCNCWSMRMGMGRRQFSDQVSHTQKCTCIQVYKQNDHDDWLFMNNCLAIFQRGIASPIVSRYWAWYYMYVSMHGLVMSNLQDWWVWLRRSVLV